MLQPYGAAVNISWPYHGVVGTSLLYGNPVPHSRLSAIRTSLPYHGPVGTTLPYGNKVGIPTAHHHSSTSQSYHELVPRYIPTIYGNLAGTPTILHTSLLYGKLVGTPTIQCAAVETSLPCHGAVGTSLLCGNPIGTPIIRHHS